MERQLEEEITKIASKDGVVGVIASDKNGLCLNAQGAASSTSSSFARSLVSRGADLSNDNEVPSVCVETESGSVAITSNADSGIVVGVWKST
eukprot:TRINITY_DN8017_c0_g1_i1.p1 TRINITY_DN8017_c0_g1~~TRINITY_DN8017_c0_g1_i1.p1  ORF type:complete len:106 (-),score=15.24 TRINITY_DN8017_c0_g1_i1:129-404(-)